MIATDSNRYRSVVPQQETVQPRKYTIQAKDFTNVEQAVPIRLVYGEARVAGVQATPVFNFDQDPVSEDDQKKGGGGSFANNEYSGTVPIIICHGLVGDDSTIELTAIDNGDTRIWTGSVNESGADSHGKVELSTTIGSIHFYFGAFDQDPSTELENLTVDLGAGAVTIPASAWPGICWALMDAVAFGKQPVAPTLIFTIRRSVRVLPAAVAGDLAQRGGWGPEIIYDALNNARYGGGLAEADEDSFDAATEICIDEGLLLSPQLDSQQQLSNFIGEILQAIDAVVYEQAGKVKIKMIRKESTVGLTEIDESDLLEEPIPAPGNFEGTWNKTVLSFTDAENKWTKGSVTYAEDANAAIVGQAVTKTFDLPAVTRHDVAVAIATRLGIQGGLPSVFWDLVLPPSFKALVPGDRLKLSYDKFGISNRVVRVRKVTRGGPTSPDVRITVQEEETRDTSNDYVTPAENFNVPGTIDGNGQGVFDPETVTPRLSILPDDIRGSFLDGFLMCVNRSSAFNVAGKVYYNWTLAPGFQAGPFGEFPAACTLLAWHQINSTRWMLRVLPETPTDYAFVKQWIENSQDLYCVVGRRDVRTVGFSKSEHQVLSPWLTVLNGGYYDLLPDSVIDIEVEGGAFSTDDLRLEASGADGYFPTTRVFFGRYGDGMTDFFIFKTMTFAFERNLTNNSADTDKKRYVRCPVGTHTTEQAATDATPVNYDRDDTTMCADGTFSHDWGAAAETTYELMDVEGGAEVDGAATDDYDTIEDIDEALGAVIDGTATADEAIKVAHIDTVLGSMIEDGHQYYSE